MCRAITKPVAQMFGAWAPDGGSVPPPLVPSLPPSPPPDLDASKFSNIPREEYGMPQIYLGSPKKEDKSWQDGRGHVPIVLHGIELPQKSIIKKKRETLG